MRAILLACMVVAAVVALAMIIGTRAGDRSRHDSTHAAPPTITQVATHAEAIERCDGAPAAKGAFRFLPASYLWTTSSEDAKLVRDDLIGSTIDMHAKFKTSARLRAPAYCYKNHRILFGLELKQDDGTWTSIAEGWVDVSQVEAMTSDTVPQTAIRHGTTIWDINSDPDLTAEDKRILTTAVERIMVENPQCARITTGNRRSAGGYYITCERTFGDSSSLFNIRFTRDDVLGGIPFRTNQ
jgi:hypothetical protein